MPLSQLHSRTVKFEIRRFEKKAKKHIEYSIKA